MERATAVDEAAADDAIFDEEIPDFVMEYLQSEEAHSDDNIPEHILEYFKNRAAALYGPGRSRPESPHAVDDTQLTEDEVRILDDARRKVDERMDELNRLRSSSSEETHSPSPVRRPGVSPDIDLNGQGQPIEDFAIGQIGELTSKPEESTGSVDREGQDQRTGNSATEKEEEPSPAAQEPFDVRTESASSHRKLKKSEKFSLRSISMPDLPDPPTQPDVVYHKTSKSASSRRFRSRSKGSKPEEEDMDVGEELDTKRSRSSRAGSSSSMRLKIKEEWEQRMEKWNTSRVVEKKFSLNDLRSRSRSRSRDQASTEKDASSEDVSRKSSESLGPIRRRIQKELDAWNTRVVVESKFHSSDFRLHRGRSREKGGEVKRTESLSPIRRRIQQELEAWNTREVVERRFSLNRGRSREKSVEVKRAQSLNPIQRKIQQEWETWNTRGVVERRVSFNRARSQDKSVEVKRAESLSPIRRKIQQGWDDFKSRARPTSSEKTPTSTRASSTAPGDQSDVELQQETVEKDTAATAGVSTLKRLKSTGKKLQNKLTDTLSRKKKNPDDESDEMVIDHEPVEPSDVSVEPEVVAKQVTLADRGLKALETTKSKIHHTGHVLQTKLTDTLKRNKKVPEKSEIEDEEMVDPQGLAMTEGVTEDQQTESVEKGSSEEPAIGLAGRGLKALQATKTKIQSTGQKLQEKLTDTLAKKRTEQDGQTSPHDQTEHGLQHQGETEEILETDVQGQDHLKSFAGRGLEALHATKFKIQQTGEKLQTKLTGTLTKTKNKQGQQHDEEHDPNPRTTESGPIENEEGVSNPISSDEQPITSEDPIQIQEETEKVNEVDVQGQGHPKSFAGRGLDALQATKFKIQQTGQKLQTKLTGTLTKTKNKQDQHHDEEHDPYTSELTESGPTEMKEDDSDPISSNEYPTTSKDTRENVPHSKSLSDRGRNAFRATKTKIQATGQKLQTKLAVSMTKKPKVKEFDDDAKPMDHVEMIPGSDENQQATNEAMEVDVSELKPMSEAEKNSLNGHHLTEIVEYRPGSGCQAYNIENIVDYSMTDSMESENGLDDGSREKVSPEKAKPETKSLIDETNDGMIVETAMVENDAEIAKNETDDDKEDFESQSPSEKMDTQLVIDVNNQVLMDDLANKCKENQVGDEEEDEEEEDSESSYEKDEQSVVESNYQTMKDAIVTEEAIDKEEDFDPDSSVSGDIQSVIEVCHKKRDSECWSDKMNKEKEESEYSSEEEDRQSVVDVADLKHNMEVIKTKEIDSQSVPNVQLKREYSETFDSKSDAANENPTFESSSQNKIEVVDCEVLDAIVFQSESKRASIDQSLASDPVEGEADSEFEASKGSRLALRGRLALQATKSKIQNTLSKQMLQNTRSKLKSTLSKGNKNLQATGQRLHKRLAVTLKKGRKNKTTADSSPSDGASLLGMEESADDIYHERVDNVVPEGGLEDVMAVAKPVTLADRGRQALSATKSKLKTTLSKDTLQATRNRLKSTGHSIIKSTLSSAKSQSSEPSPPTDQGEPVAQRRKTKKPIATNGAKKEALPRTDLGAAVDTVESQAEPIVVPRRVRKKAADKAEASSHRLSFPTAKRRVKKLGASHQLTYSRLVYESRRSQIEHDDEDATEDELEPRLEFHLHEIHVERPPSVNQATNTMPEEGLEYDEEGDESFCEELRKVFARPVSSEFDIDHVTTDCFCLPIESTPDRHEPTTIVHSGTTYPDYENVRYVAPPRRSKRLDKTSSGSVSELDTELLAEKPTAPKRTKPAKPTSDEADEPPPSAPRRWRSRSLISRDAVSDMETSSVDSSEQTQFATKPPRSANPWLANQERRSRLSRSREPSVGAITRVEDTQYVTKPARPVTMWQNSSEERRSRLSRSREPSVTPDSRKYSVDRLENAQFVTKPARPVNPWKDSSEEPQSRLPRSREPSAPPRLKRSVTPVSRTYSVGCIEDTQFVAKTTPPVYQWQSSMERRSRLSRSRELSAPPPRARLSMDCLEDAQFVTKPARPVNQWQDSEELRSRLSRSREPSAPPRARRSATPSIKEQDRWATWKQPGDVDENNYAEIKEYFRRTPTPPPPPPLPVRSPPGSSGFQAASYSPERWTESYSDRVTRVSKPVRKIESQSFSTTDVSERDCSAPWITRATRTRETSAPPRTHRRTPSTSAPPSKECSVDPLDSSIPVVSVTKPESPAFNSGMTVDYVPLGAAAEQQVIGLGVEPHRKRSPSASSEAFELDDRELECLEERERSLEPDDGDDLDDLSDQVRQATAGVVVGKLVISRTDSGSEAIEDRSHTGLNVDDHDRSEDDVALDEGDYALDEDFTPHEDLELDAMHQADGFQENYNPQDNLEDRKSADLKLEDGVEFQPREEEFGADKNQLEDSLTYRRQEDQFQEDLDPMHEDQEGLIEKEGEEQRVEDEQLSQEGSDDEVYRKMKGYSVDEEMASNRDDDEYYDHKKLEEDVEYEQDDDDFYDKEKEYYSEEVDYEPEDEDFDGQDEAYPEEEEESHEEEVDAPKEDPIVARSEGEDFVSQDEAYPQEDEELHEEEVDAPKENPIAARPEEEELYISDKFFPQAYNIRKPKIENPCEEGATSRPEEEAKAVQEPEEKPSNEHEDIAKPSEPADCYKGEKYQPPVREKIIRSSKYFPLKDDFYGYGEYLLEDEEKRPKRRLAAHLPQTDDLPQSEEAIAQHHDYLQQLEVSSQPPVRAAPLRDESLQSTEEGALLRNDSLQNIEEDTLLRNNSLQSSEDPAFLRTESLLSSEDPALSHDENLLSSEDPVLSRDESLQKSEDAAHLDEEEEELYDEEEEYYLDEDDGNIQPNEDDFDPIGEEEEMNPEEDELNFTRSDVTSRSEDVISRSEVVSRSDDSVNRFEQELSRFEQNVFRLQQDLSNFREELNPTEETDVAADFEDELESPIPEFRNNHSRGFVWKHEEMPSRDTSRQQVSQFLESFATDAVQVEPPGRGATGSAKSVDVSGGGTGAGSWPPSQPTQSPAPTVPHRSRSKSKSRTGQRDVSNSLERDYGSPVRPSRYRDLSVESSDVESIHHGVPPLQIKRLSESPGLRRKKFGVHPWRSEEEPLVEERPTLAERRGRSRSPSLLTWSRKLLQNMPKVPSLPSIPKRSRSRSQVRETVMRNIESLVRFTKAQTEPPSEEAPAPPPAPHRERRSASVKPSPAYRPIPEVVIHSPSQLLAKRARSVSASSPTGGLAAPTVNRDEDFSRESSVELPIASRRRERTIPSFTIPSFMRNSGREQATPTATSLALSGVADVRGLVHEPAIAEPIEPILPVPRAKPRVSIVLPQEDAQEVQPIVAETSTKNSRPVVDEAEPVVESQKLVELTPKYLQEMPKNRSDESSVRAASKKEPPSVAWKTVDCYRLARAALVQEINPTPKESAVTPVRVEAKTAMTVETSRDVVRVEDKNEKLLLLMLHLVSVSMFLLGMASRTFGLD